MSKTTEILEAKLASKAMEMLDIDALAKEMLPAIKKEIQIQIMSYFRNDVEWADIINNIMDRRGVQNAIGKKIEEAFK